MIKMIQGDSLSYSVSSSQHLEKFQNEALVQFLVSIVSSEQPIMNPRPDLISLMPSWMVSPCSTMAI